MKVGDIVYFNNLVFKDGKKDKKENRPCIYLFEENINNIDYVYSIPITSKVVRFNNVNDNNLVFIPETIYNYRKLSFAKIDNILKLLKSDMKYSEIKLANETVKRIIEKAINNNEDELINQKLFELISNLESDYTEPILTKRYIKRKNF